MTKHNEHYYEKGRNGWTPSSTIGEVYYEKPKINPKMFLNKEELKTIENRKKTPVFSGVLKYFPDALREISRVSLAGNNQHHPGKPLHWDRNKSTDELDALARHLIDAGTLDTDGIRHSAKVAWRALANLQKELENEE